MLERSYELFVDRGKGLVAAGQSKSPEVLKGSARNIHQAEGCNSKTVYDIRLNGLSVQRSSHNGSGRLRWKKVPGLVAA